jgi:hypothetical protein
MGMRQGVGRQRSAAKLAEDSPIREPRPGIDQHTSHQVDVEAERWKTAEQFQILRNPPHEELLAIGPSFLSSIDAKPGSKKTTRFFTRGEEPGGKSNHLTLL